MGCNKIWHEDRGFPGWQISRC